MKHLYLQPAAMLCLMEENDILTLSGNNAKGDDLEISLSDE